MFTMDTDMDRVFIVLEEDGDNYYDPHIIRVLTDEKEALLLAWTLAFNNSGYPEYSIEEWRVDSGDHAPQKITTVDLFRLRATFVSETVADIKQEMLQMRLIPDRLLPFTHTRH